MKTTQIHLIYGVILSICMGGILHLKYCRMAVMEQYFNVSGTALQAIRNQDQRMLIISARFVERNVSMQNMDYLNKLWETDSLLQEAFGDLQTLPAADLPGYRNIFTSRIKALYHDNEEALKIINNFPTGGEGLILGEQEIREILPLEYRLMSSELYQLCMSRITGDGWGCLWEIPFLLPVQKHVYQSDMVHLGVMHGFWKSNYYVVKIGGTTKNMREGVFTLDTVFQHAGVYPVPVELLVGGKGRLPAQYYHDTIQLQIFPK